MCIRARTRGYRQPSYVDKTNAATIKSMLPYAYERAAGKHILRRERKEIEKMARIKGATMTHKRRKKMLKLAKGFYGCKTITLSPNVG